MPKRILVIEDDRGTRTLVQKTLEKEGYEITGVSDGEEGISTYLKSIKDNHFQLIILDINMPGINGLEVLKNIRKEEESRGIKYGYGSSIPIIMLTASKEPWLDAFDSGCDDYILKPFENDKLLKKVSEKFK
ncbi:MAG: response regulator [Candidatus Omnitrophica bacterium]|nr:response regulator [Candidatus Omnitrophota bacterium]